ncbi:MaoC family dehydratase [Paraburkholderia unamae]|jgi:acyl dehydratase|uniref:Acyl dehydratase n=1 Tax=Paraburkholderia unamae TaxID=219649 RepID=A0ABX5KBQ0_9BURK|nr:MaoC family dehydratase [Paraburkholderia unamae]PVX71590.1 acyl dehydratase [Paraburkholderia unamae]CAG9274689.1 MaoC domain protein dehydratase [Paraburkholderia unamae]
MAGLYYEQLEPGLVVEHAIRRTVTEMDNTLYSALTYNCAPLHIDAEYSKDSIFGQRIVNSMFLLGLVTGVTVIDTTIGTTLGNLGFEEIKFPKPVFHGDTIRVTTEILDRRESKKREDSGIVFFKHVAYNQRDEIVCEMKRAGLMLKRAWVESQRKQA